MPDIIIQCTSCSNEITVSDVVDISKLKCRGCGGSFLRANSPDKGSDPNASEKKRPLIKAKTTTGAEAQPEPQEAAPTEPHKRLIWEKLNNTKGQKEVAKESRKMYSSLTWKAWLVFVIVASVCGFLRYGGVIPDATIREAAIYQALTLLVFHIVITLKAFQDSVFQGVLCILIPPYSIYYLFSASDDFMLRATIAGLLVGIGQDAGILFHEWSINVIDTVNEWIASGG